MNHQDVAIRVENLSKRYRIGLEGEIHDTLAGAFSSFLRSPLKNLRRLQRLTSFKDGDDQQDVIWALKGISFEVQRGEVLGVIGHNGAGKSTLLKVLSRITDPSSGRIEIDGRVASLLEVGTGFHPELTGRENIYLNGTILGMTRVEIDRKFDEIVSFSGVEKFIDTPVKRYSSGMRVRLAFSVAAHLEPEILLVDEVLAVGDAAFQKKSLGKMGDVAKEGRTVLFVSHNMGAITQLCSRTILLDQGKLSLDAQTEDVISAYLARTSNPSGHISWSDGYANENTTELKIYQIEIKDPMRKSVNMLDARKPFSIEIVYEVFNQIPTCRMGISINTIQGITVFTGYDIDNQDFLERRIPGRYLLSCEVPGYLLEPGSYSITVNVGIPRVKNLVYLPNILTFEIENTMKYKSFGGQRSGIIQSPLSWRNEKL